MLFGRSLVFLLPSKVFGYSSSSPRALVYRPFLYGFGWMQHLLSCGRASLFSLICFLDNALTEGVQFFRPFELRLSGTRDFRLLLRDRLSKDVERARPEFGVWVFVATSYS